MVNRHMDVEGSDLVAYLKEQSVHSPGKIEKNHRMSQPGKQKRGSRFEKNTFRILATFQNPVL
jgi:hypothetical protein